jgi:hypothetical protein
VIQSSRIVALPVNVRGERNFHGAGPVFERGVTDRTQVPCTGVQSSNEVTLNTHRVRGT